MEPALSIAVSAGLILLAYLLGSIPFAIVISKLMGLQDPRSFGSGNPGATNVLRTGNRKAAVLTLLGDAAKGWLAVMLAYWGHRAFGVTIGVVAACAVAAFLGHVYSFFLKFKGGKGVATGLGVLLGLQPWLALAVALTWLLVAYVSRYSSLAAIIAALLAPLYYLMGAKAVWPMHASFAVAIVIVSVVILHRHKQNISRLLQGKETKIGAGKSQQPPAPPRKKSRR
ncbi:glycerol-3-phosphate 1-O-acyltransferase PlsY [Yanghanlia caeni]|uniref:Glycerol-3-phosphate acyltransferase n=1 Tax=Yanghanlia caeni TaxID=3064283 RepID=A0ABU1D678_9BURK|nr:glycerol-3-phosphate 1-O-acyltransferase PlsY [Alcaligenaceae bacterium LG-2]NGR06450.1 glycerol-3-phosphate 1-O-acyltransferase PlsY [bacterium SGD-2]HZH55759.1 glycerol-3-phosphate 1-O-acyltransferase PlsY [Burkholderiaceae bacterium]